MIPYDINGNLPPGIHKLSWQRFVDQFGFNNHRKHLLEGLYKALVSLKQAGCIKVYVNGSFVTIKDKPEDFDGYWDVTGVDFDKVDPILLDLSNNRMAQKAKYGGELFANVRGAREESYILEFFQIDKDLNPKGIIEISLDTLP